MIHTVRVATKAPTDPHGADVLAEVRRTLGIETLETVRTVRVYRLEGVTGAEATRLGRVLLCDPVDHHYTVDCPIATGADRVVEVAYLPGVMNPEAASILRAASDLGITPVAVDSSREYAFFGRLGDEDLDRILGRLLVNPTIEQIVTVEPDTLQIGGEPGPTRRVPIRDMSDAELTELAADGLYLDLAEMKAIQAHFRAIGRYPSDLELEALAQTWSEHCKHKTFRAAVTINGEAKRPFMTRLKEVAALFDDLVVSAFVDNSGVMRFYDGWAIAGKVETHNSPSAIEPYGGAMTGSGGVFRDIMGTGQGARVIASTDMFCFAPPDLSVDQVPPGALPPDYLLRRVVAGVRDYGNRMGIPTNNGSVHFHRDFRAKPTVIVGAYGLVPEDRARKGRPRPGDRILALGGRTGRDGIHGATFSSAAMTSTTMEVNATAVQIGNAVEEKRLSDALLACRDQGLVQAITDCGAGGFSSAVGEMAEDLGAEVQLDRVPLKYPGLAPWEIFLSESQERMVMAVDPEGVERVMEICAIYNVEVTDIGQFVDTGRLHVCHGQEVVGDLAMEFLHHGLPERELAGDWRPFVGPSQLPPAPAAADEWARRLLEVLGHPTVASKEPIARQYDHTVQASAVVGPYGGPRGGGPSDAAVIAPLLGRPFGVVIAHGLNPVLNVFDPYWGGLWAAAEALANYVAVGGDPREVCLIDNFIWPVPEGPALGALDRAVDACVDVMHALERPFISGKDSLSSTYRFPDGSRLDIPPVLCISAFGRIPDVAATCTAEFKAAGSTIVVVGTPDHGGMGGSIYLEVCGLVGERPPRVDLAALRGALEAVHGAIVSGKVLACHDVSEGGLAVALAEMAMGGRLGVDVDLAVLGGPGEIALFNETSGVFVLELAADTDVAALLGDVEHRVIGRTTADGVLRLRDGAREVCRLTLEALEAAWLRPMGEVFH